MGNRRHIVIEIWGLLLTDWRSFKNVLRVFGVFDFYWDSQADMFGIIEGSNISDFLHFLSHWPHLMIFSGSFFLVSSYKDLTRKIELDLNWSFTISTTCIRTNCHKTSQPTGEISFGDSHFWEKNPAKTKRETYLLSLYGKLVGWKLSLSPEVMSEGPDAGSAEQPKKKWCDDRKQWGKWGKGDDFFGDFQRKISVPQRFWLGEWVKLTEIDQSINESVQPRD